MRGGWPALGAFARRAASSGSKRSRRRTASERTAERDEKFARELDEAETLCRIRPLKKMYLAMESHWRAAAWMLERLHPDQFGRGRQGLTHSQREELRLVADRLCAEIGQSAPAAAPANSLVEMEKQMDELRAYQHERDGRAADEKVESAPGKPR